VTESVIAASIIVAALNNIFPKVTEGRWRIAFAFGLLHGFGLRLYWRTWTAAWRASGVAGGVQSRSRAGAASCSDGRHAVAYAVRATAFYRQTVYAVGIVRHRRTGPRCGWFSVRLGDGGPASDLGARGNRAYTFREHGLHAPLARGRRACARTRARFGSSTPQTTTPRSAPPARAGIPAGALLRTREHFRWEYWSPA